MFYNFFLKQNLESRLQIVSAREKGDQFVGIVILYSVKLSNALHIERERERESERETRRYFFAF